MEAVMDKTTEVRSWTLLEWLIVIATVWVILWAILYGGPSEVGS